MIKVIQYLNNRGHESRLNREELFNCFDFGSATYAKEELMAEMTAAFLGAITGIGQLTVGNSAAYILTTGLTL